MELRQRIGHCESDTHDKTRERSSAATAHNARMRINLVTPFEEKEAAKGLGARWDGKLKVWYISDVKDLTPFLRWIPDMKVATAGLAIKPVVPATKSPVNASGGTWPPVTTTSNIQVPHCECDVLPWEDCVHSQGADHHPIPNVRAS